EPLEIMEANNALREAELAERIEVERILDELSRRIEKSSEDLDVTTTALAALDLILAKALYADSLQATRPELNAEGILDLVDARRRRAGRPRASRRGRRGNRSGRGCGARNGRARNAARARRPGRRDDALPGAEGLRAQHAGSAQREHGVRFEHPSSYVPTPYRTAWRIQRLRHRRAPGFGQERSGSRGHAPLRAPSLARAHPARGGATTHRAQLGARR